jgi:hypothetical protein
MSQCRCIRRINGAVVMCDQPAGHKGAHYDSTIKASWDKRVAVRMIASKEGAK